jgi:transcription elongation factor Elf1
VSPTPRPITRERAQRIAKAHACEKCGEYSYKRLSIRPATADQRAEFGEHWHVTKVCGVCGQEQDMGIDAEGEVVYVA